MLVAATAFTVLTAAARTAQVRTVGAVRAHFRPAYDILVRPRGARSRLESATGTVQPDFLSGIYGGITLAQWHQIQHISGVQVAAPIAMVGYGFMNADFPVWLPHADVTRPGRQLYRASTTWVSANGASRIHQPPTYVYVTPDRVHTASSTGATTEILPGGSRVSTCPALAPTADPFSPATLTMAWCWSKVNGLGEKGQLVSPDLMGRPGFGVDWQFPMLIAAIDPAAEARLDGLNHALTSGQYLPETYPGKYGGVDYRPGGPFPVLATTDSGVGEYSVTQVQQLAAPAGAAGAESSDDEPGSGPARPHGARHDDHGPAGLPVPARPDARQAGTPGQRRAGLLVRRPGALPARPRRRPGPGHGAQPGLDLAAARHGHLLRAPGQRRHSVPDTARACARQQQHASGADHDRDVQHGEDPGLRSAVPRPARAV